VRTEAVVQVASSRLDQIRREINKIIVGQQDVIDGVLICLLSGGHVLLEGVPGLGKTTLLRTLARALHLRHSRIQFTPDLMPADIIGSMIIETDERGAKALRFQPGPVFANLVLADEINRATPKTQSALLEAMQERTVTSGTTTHELEAPFLVMATQNPIEMEGTYPLPEAQLDRFLMKIVVNYPNRDEMVTIVERTIQKDDPQIQQVVNRAEILEVRSVCRDVLVASHVQDFAVDLVLATQPDKIGRAHV
jgi:MoxR-like ATPase